MLSFFPTPYPDELLYSVFARYHVRAGNKSYKMTMGELFNSQTASAIVDLPCNIRNLVGNMPPKSLYNAEELIREHTLFPFYTAFLPPERAKQIYNSMLGSRGGDIYTRAGIMANGISANRYLKFCPACASEALQQHGEMYWHRIHQVPFLLCPIHKIQLLDSIVPCIGINKHEYISASPENCPKSEVKDLKPEIQQHLRTLTDLSQCLIDLSLPNRELEWFKFQYREILKTKGYASANGTLRKKKLLSDFLEFYGAEFLQLLQSPIKIFGDSNWLTDMLYSKEKAAHPIRHLLFIGFLGISMKDLFFRKFEYSPFGSGPWPCLNLAADHYLEPIIGTVKVQYNADNKRPLGIFACGCGFVYTRSGPDKADTDRYTFGRIRTFGHVWESKLKAVVAEKHSLRETARLMGVDPATVKKHAKRLGIETFWENRKEEENRIDAKAEKLNTEMEENKIREQHREMWLQLQHENPHKGKKELRLMNRGTYAWLYHNDRKWMDEHSPARKKVYVNTRVDWEKRDLDICQQVQELVEEMRNSEEKPIRICTSSIGKSLGLRAILQQHMEKLPRTNAYIKSVAEADSEFRLRRICWAVRKMKKEGEDIAEWRILKKAGIRTEYLYELKNMNLLELDNER
ncbi:Tn7-like transposition protein D [Ruminiclostridium papyrosolvens DSM 2782]|jgi:hypothetical protein|uniref:Tn7-like transposition protein D n=1 Tax=Ruminiclostridium papyrosolvens DSM 2782 TaxID=588581 RepID=F1T7X7_9FIRM|nr:TnsD family Tn7-like transposition protein [Ruminiclostridium papyrosolvens]EGD49575.1 Tn7-like transposition protein D [Ruminiclostridium papyrosolvens DSM 2782]WES33301.1 TnsD family transposase [Ruminiclostridium papyrosolvens DSM 2782]